jgi:tripartite-type tricarboxylate transporter receptor subunit TctC
LPGFECVFRAGLFAPTGTPADIIARLNRESVQVLRRADNQNRLLAAGMEPVGSTPEEFAAVIRSELVMIGKVIKDAGIKEE